MMNSYICFAFLSWMLLYRVSTQLLDLNCGTVSRFDNHVISDSPWMALIIIPNKTCTGTLIHTQFVVTSANCVFNQSDSSSSRQLPSNSTVRLGDFKSPKLEDFSNEYTPINYNIRSAYIHYSYEEKTYNNDIALLELAEDVLYKAHIRPICIWLDDIAVKKHKSFYATRWGLDGNINSGSRTNPITIFKPKKCEKTLNLSPQNFQICAGYKTNNTNCAELGSPLIHNIKRNNHTFSTLFGIQSYGDLETCLYTNISSYTNWMVGIILEVDVVVSNLEHAYN
nr:CLIP domain-containing serine protease B9 [Drosophila takahashii]